MATKAVSTSSFEVVNVDTTVQTKAVAFPTDTRLLHKARMALVRLAVKHGITLRQSYARVGLVASIKAQRYAHARQMNRAKAQTRKLRTYLGRVIRDVQRKIAHDGGSNANGNGSGNGVIAKHFERLLEVATRIQTQPRRRAPGDAPKIYSVHAPEVECIAKGKVHQPYEFGVKVGLVTTSKDNFVLAAPALPGNPYDGHTLKQCLAQAARVCGVAAREAYTDLGYKGHGCNSDQLTVWLSGAKRGVTAAIKRKIKRRSAIEPVIGHMKSDGRLSRNYLKGADGDAINALMCAVGHNLRKILKKLRLFYAFFYTLLVSALKLNLQNQLSYQAVTRQN